ncbi:MAG TPA: winged helix-turn-helix transcriptional regulator [Thermoleophilaceae bacterium]|nr:winged helix-turn-helix transcriptional regulator [Thermoleophilaceae bacterium]
MTEGHGERDWLFLTNHAHVLICIAREPGIRMREIATKVGITERAVQLIVRDLERGGYLSVERVGRRNSYVVRSSAPMRHKLHEGHSIDDLVAVLR